MPKRRRNESSVTRREFIRRLAGLGLTASVASALLALSSCKPKASAPKTSLTTPSVKPTNSAITTSTAPQTSETTSPPPTSTSRSSSTTVSTPPVSTPGASTPVLTTNPPPVSSTATPTISSTAPSTPPATNPEEEPLPQPFATGTPVELCLNSRYSEHTLTGTAIIQQIANVLWAMSKAPVTGAYRNITVVNNNGTYAYNPATHALIKGSAQHISGGAFMVRSQSEVYFDDGAAYTLATLASIAMWKSSGAQVASCIRLTDLYFGVQNVKGLNPELAVRSSAASGLPGFLPDPVISGQNSFEDVIARINYTSSCANRNLTPDEISQLLWAGYGCTPHQATIGRRQGLTVPSAVAAYYLTGMIYVCNSSGIFRYHNRKPDNDLTTRDHRLEVISESDVRESLKTAGGLPQAPCYIIIAVKQSIAGSSQPGRWALMEAGFAGAGMLLQAAALCLGCHFNTKFTPAEAAGTQKAAGLPAADIPQAIVSLGQPAQS